MERSGCTAFEHGGHMEMRKHLSKDMKIGIKYCSLQQHGKVQSKFTSIAHQTLMTLGPSPVRCTL